MSCDYEKDFRERRNADIVRLYLEGMTPTEVSHHWNVSVALVTTVIRKAGVVRHQYPTRPGTQERVDRVLRLAADGHTPEHIAQTIGISTEYASHILSDGGGTRFKLRNQRRNEAIARLRAAGHTYREIAAEYGLTYQRVEQILRRMPKNRVAILRIQNVARMISAMQGVAA